MTKPLLLQADINTWRAELGEPDELFPMLATGTNNRRDADRILRQRLRRDVYALNKMTKEHKLQTFYFELANSISPYSKKKTSQSNGTIKTNGSQARYVEYTL